MASDVCKRDAGDVRLTTGRPIAEVAQRGSELKRQQHRPAQAEHDHRAVLGLSEAPAMDIATTTAQHQLGKAPADG